ncbi:hypothetical protein ALI22I_00735 [Saccharothrix sp. ALI-22-I]|uniref:SDR family oxidoreductase n=1 Tax=Saccharothrix sp. ALI-22-I TaxID=1933778 RepID=UPI00097C07EF|nr:SDR family oxidoreductase [Saccharothrix sp. ALI-22-I]ONI92992.1 hypothetical protein ALI22I_00735 [Saccharothrix sp. ALI-22-I]
MTPPRLLLTGATGVLGPALVAEFGGSRFVALEHRTPVGDPDVEVVRGDVTAERFGLDTDTYERLLKEVDGVLHAAALTSVAWPAEEISRANILGTRNAMRFAEDAGVPLHHISTFYVQGRDGTHDSTPANAYQSSKREAEDVVRTAEVPTAIYRLPMVLGDSTTGAITRFQGQGIYVAAKALVCGNAHVLPVPDGSYVDFLPRDHVARCVRIGVDAGVTGEHWVTAGRAALTFEQFVEECMGLAAELGREVVRPKVVDPGVVERLFLPAFGDSIPPDLRVQLRMGTRVVRGMSNEQWLPEPGETLPEGVDFPSTPDLADCLARSLRYWAANTTLPPAIPLQREGTL